MEDRMRGVMVYYYFVCKRKLWYFCHEINMEAENEDVLLGKILDENSYKRNEKHINIDDTINIDFIAGRKELHEIKKSKAVEEAGIWQVKYYLYYLQKRGVNGIKGRIDYPLLRKTVSVELLDEDIKQMEEILNGIIKIKDMEIPPICIYAKICKRCAYHDLCYI